MTRHKSTNILLQITIFLGVLTISNNLYQIAAQGVETIQVKLTKCSAYQIDGSLANAIAADEDLVYVGTSDGQVQALNAGISSSVWRSELGGEIVSNIASTETGILVVSNPVKTTESIPAESILRSLSKETGVPAWTVRLPYSEHFFLASVKGSTAIVSREGLAIAVDGQTGRILWRTQALGRITARPSFFPHGIAFGTAEKQMVIVSPETGAIIFKGSTDFVPTAITHPSPEILVVGDERGNVASIDVPGGKNIWKFKSGGGISFASVSKEGLFITSNDNFIYLIWMYNGDVIWKRRLPGRVIEGLTIVDGFVTALVYGENSGFLIDSKKGKIIDQLPQSDKNFINQMPVPAKDSNLLVATADAVTAYAVKGCEQKIGKAASLTPPFAKK